MPIEQAIKDRRRDFRWPAGGSAGWIAPNYTFSLHDISRGGALIEHAHLVRPGTQLFMNLLIHERPVGLKCRVVRSRDYRYEVLPTGEHDHFYLTGLEFLGLSEDARGLIDEYIFSLGE
ncbi:MAG: PilZ domain-containing protein [Candidatus Methylomirabilales bacterium]